MKIILLKDVRTLGEAGSVLKVAPGYARNYLIPHNIAVIANKGNLAKVEEIKKQAELERLEIENKYKALVLQIAEVELEFIRKADENDHLFGSVSETDIVNALQEKEIEIHKSHVTMEKHLKEIGAFEVPINFTTEISTVLKVKINKE